MTPDTLAAHQSAQTLGKYGHHPNAEIDADVEIERLQGLLFEARAGLMRGLDYQAITSNGLAIKYDLRDALRRTDPNTVQP